VLLRVASVSAISGGVSQPKNDKPESKVDIRFNRNKRVLELLDAGFHRQGGRKLPWLKQVLFEILEVRTL
jgi:hypothetical protein